MPASTRTSTWPSPVGGAQCAGGTAADVLIVDTFPAGGFFELVAALEMARTGAGAASGQGAVAEEEAYQALLPLYNLQVDPDDRGCGPIVIREREELLPKATARAALGIPDGQRAVYVSLGGGGDPAAPNLLPRAVTMLRAAGWHVVVGAGPLYAGRELRGEGITWLDRYVPVELFAGVDAAVSAGGYNSFHELMFAGVPTVFLPQPRIADDQAERWTGPWRWGPGSGRSASKTSRSCRSRGNPEAARSLVPERSAHGGSSDPVAGGPRRCEARGRGTHRHWWAERDGWGLDQGLSVVRMLAGSAPSARARPKPEPRLGSGRPCGAVLHSLRRP